MKKTFAIVAISLILAACGQKESVSSGSSTLEGTYVLENAVDTLIFTKQGQVTSKHPRYPEKITNYKKEGDEVVFQFAEGYPMKLTVVDDAHIKSDLLGKFVKQ